MLRIVTLLLVGLLLSIEAQAQSDLSALVAGAKTEKEVLWYTTTSAGDNQAIVAGFSKKYPFVRVQVLRSTGEKLRQRVLAENVANSDTPKYRAHDLAPLKFEDPPLAGPSTVSAVSLTRTADSHIAGVGLSESPFRAANTRDFEVRPAGNAVNLEDEMMKVAANQMDFQTATALYTRSLNLIKTALGKR